MPVRMIAVVKEDVELRQRPNESAQFFKHSARLEDVKRPPGAFGCRDESAHIGGNIDADKLTIPVQLHRRQYGDRGFSIRDSRFEHESGPSPANQSKEDHLGGSA